MDIAAWLRSLGLESYEAAFRDNAIDGEVLTDLTEADLERLGVLLGHRKKMLRSIAGLQAEQQPVGAAPPPLSEAEGERRQVTVLFADLVGYTALSSRLDSEDVHGLLGRFFAAADRIVADHGGHIDKHIGDSVMAVFGAPIAHGNDAERASLAALAIRAAMPALARQSDAALQVHIGIAAGTVIASATGSASHREYTVTGETVNLAARLTEAAGPGDILISTPVAQALGTKFLGSDAGALAVKGFAAPVPAHRLQGLRPAAAGDFTLLAGRRKEMQQFQAALAFCRDSGQGGAFYVRGEAGIGKTRLLREFEREAAAAGFACDRGLVLDFGAGIDAVRSLVRSMLGLASDADGEARTRAAAAAVQEGSAGAADVAFLNDLLDLTPSGGERSLFDAMDHAARHRGRQGLLTRLVTTLCRRRPRLLLVEDVHWADETTRSYLATLANATAECAALLVMTSRPENDLLQPRWRAAAGGTSLTTIDLGPLKRDEALALARSAIGTDAALAERLADRAEGNPLFLEQLLRHSREDSQTAVPGSVQALVQARVDRLAAASRRALQAASVLGQRFSLAALRSLLDEPAFDGADLVAHALLRQAGEELLFAHALIRDAVYASLLRTRRRELHRSAADWYASRDAALRAEHLDRAEDAAAPGAYADAVEAEAARLRHETALRLAERGLALAAMADDRLRLGLLRAMALRELGRIPESLAAFRAVAETTAEGLGQCRAWIGVASCVRLLGGNEEGFAALQAAEPLARRFRAARELSEIHYYFGALRFALGDIDGCLRHHADAHGFALTAQDAECEAQALSGLGDAHYGRGRMRQAIDHFRRCQALCRERGFGRIEVGSTHMIGAIRRYLSEGEQALADLRQAAATAAKVGNIRTQMVALNILGEILVDAGRTAEARDTLLAALRLAEDFANPRYRAYVLYELGRAHYYDPARRGEAPAVLSEALALCRQIDMHFVGPRVLAALALAKDVERPTLLAEGEAVLRDGCLVHNGLWFYRDAIEAHLKARDFAEARQSAAALAAYTGGDPLPWSDFFIARGRALADHGDGGRDPALFASLQRLRDAGARAGLIAALPEIDAALAAA